MHLRAGKRSLVIPAAYSLCHTLMVNMLRIGVILGSENITDLASTMRLVSADLEEENFQKMARTDGFVVEQPVLGVMLQVVRAFPVSEETSSTEIIAGGTMSMAHATAERFHISWT